MSLTHRSVAVETYNAAWLLLEGVRDAAGDRDLVGLRDRHVTLGVALLAQESDADDRAVVQAQLDEVRAG